MGLFARDRTWEFQKTGFSKETPKDKDWWKGKKNLKLHLGCDKFFVPGWVNIDNRNLGQDLVCDLNQLPWPFEDESVEEIVAHNVFEHLDDINVAMGECYRILKPGGKIFACVPHGQYKGYLQDPTHRRPFSFETFDYFTTNPKRYGYFKFAFSQVHVDMWLGRMQYYVAFAMAALIIYFGLVLHWSATQTLLLIPLSLLSLEPVINLNKWSKLLYEQSPLKVFLNGDLMVEMEK